MPYRVAIQLEWMRKLEIQDVRRIRKEINYLNLEILAGIKFGVVPKIAIGRILADLNLAVRYGIAIRIICE